MNRNSTAIILVVLAIGVYFTFTSDQIKQARAIKSVNDEYSAAIKNAVELIKIRDNILSQYKALSEEDQIRLDKMIPSTVDNIRLIIDLNEVSKRHGFSLRNVKAETPASQQSSANNLGQNSSNQVAGITIPVLDTVKVSFSASAPYLEFISFLQDIEANLRIMDITSLNVVVKDTGGYDFEVELKTYWLRQ